MKLLVASITRSTQRRGYLRISHSKAAMSFRYPHERAPTPCTNLLELGCHKSLARIWMESENSFSLPLFFFSFCPRLLPYRIGRVRWFTFLATGRAHFMCLTGLEHSL